MMSIQNRLACFISIKRFLSTKHKRPLKRQNENEMPVFEYTTSKKNYRRVYVWGNIQTGALGVPYLKRGENIMKREFVAWPKRLGFAEKFEVKTAACGFGFSLIATKDQVYGMGLNTDSQIGYHAMRAGHPLEIIYFPQLINLPLQPEEEILKIKAGRAHSVVLTNKRMFLFGNNAYGQCGRRIVEDEDYIHSNYINEITTLDDKPIIDIECGQDHTLAITSDGCVYSCGWSADGQTGLGHYHNTPEFSRVGGDIKGEKIVKINSRSDFVMALNDKGEVFGWGNSEYGQLVDPKVTQQQQISTPIFMEKLRPFGKVRDVASGGSFCLVLNEDGHVFSWGYGILGTSGKADFSFLPKQISNNFFGHNEFGGSTIEKIDCGLNYSVAISDRGNLYSWGRNLKCCLGIGDEKDQFFPLKVSMGGIIEEIACGLDHSIAVCKPLI